MKKIYWSIIILSLIVILYIFGIFLYKLFFQSSDYLITDSYNPLPIEATLGNPLIIEDNLEVKAGGKTPFQIYIFNIYNEELIYAKPYIESCDNNVNITLLSIASQIVPSKEMRYMNVLTTPRKTLPGEYICNVTINSDNIPNAFSKQVIIKVT